MKIKIIDLLAKIANGEEIPEKIAYCGVILKYDEKKEDYYRYYGRGLFEYKFSKYINFLNDEVEIIEEPKKIEHCLKSDRFLRNEDEIEYLRTKIDELIDEISNLKEND